MDDADTLFKLVNEAYEVETGSTGVAFKHSPRLISKEKELFPLIFSNQFLVARDCDNNGSILGGTYF